MADQLKTFFSPQLVSQLAESIHTVHPVFPTRDFTKRASNGLGDLELLDRARHISAALAASLPPKYPDAVDVLVRSLGPEHRTDELIGGGMSAFFYMPHVIFVAERGLDHFDLSMQAQYELTKRFTAEFRSRDANAHVRRLVSEGTRLRLPWAPRVRWLDEHPERVIELLELLRDDPSSMVRRSVANNLNDLGKPHTTLLVQTCAKWLEEASAERRALVEHAMRSAVKRGDRAVLKLLGYGTQAAVSLEDVALRPRRVKIGERVSVSFSLRNRARRTEALLVDLAVHFVKAAGKTGRKVFKLKRVSLAPGEVVSFQKSISLAVHTTRVPRAGAHAVEVVVNGSVLNLGSFMVTRR
jgi:3-methyladenine DNA glycosylase AlkC